MASREGSIGLHVLLITLFCGLAAGENTKLNQGRKMLADEMVSILDGVMASPDLGPQTAAVAPAAAATATAVSASSGSHGRHCGSGCIAGSVIGSVVGFSLLVTAAVYLYKRRGACGCTDRSPSLDPLDNTYSISMENKQPKRFFQKGDRVFCRCGGGCDFGTVTSKGDGDEYYVKLIDGSAKTVDSSHLALNLSKGSPVLYTPPAGGETVKGTIVASDGSYWPPFYQLETDDATKDAINTTAECLQAAKPTLGNPQ